MNYTSIILMGPAQEGQEGGNSSFLIMMALLFVVMYFFMIRPNVKRNKEQQKYRENLKKGDRIVTTGGIHGRISEMKDTTVVIETEGGGKLRIEKSGISMEASAALNKADQKS